jgi:RND family efflux transporter MFP subunit
VLIRSDAFAGKVFEGRVKAITPKGDPVARTYRVRVSLPPDAPLMIGMTAETNIVLRKEDNALLVPAGAVHQDAVWRVADGKLEKQKVVVGAKDAREVEILSGLREGDRIVASPTPGLTAGENVRPYEAAAR